MAKLGSMDNGSLHFDALIIYGKQMLNLDQVDKTLIISQFNDIWTIENLFSRDLHICWIICYAWIKFTIYTLKNTTLFS